MAIQRLFQRKYKLSIGEPVNAAGTSSVEAAKGILITDLQMKFDICRSVKAENDKAEISVYNLSEASRSKFFQKDKVCRLDVAYGDGEFTTLFSGEIERVSTEKQGADFVTRLIVSDAAVVSRESRTERSFAPGVTLMRILETLVIKDMGLPFVGDNAQLPAGTGLDKVYANGVSVSAKTQAWIQKACETADINFFIQDGKAYAIPIKYPRNTSIVPKYTPTSGLVGSPQAIVPKKKKSCLKDSEDPEAGTEFKVLLDPSLQVGGRVVIESKDVNGTFKLVKVKHQGDFRGSSWYSTCEADEIETSTE